MLKVVLIVLCIGVVASAKTPCTSNLECGSNQCCYKRPEFLIMSRRQLQSDLHQHGVCEDYQPMGTPCSPFDKLNGHCSCGQGLTCHFVPAEMTTQGIVRRKLYMPGPGSYQCAKPQH